jgi:hypothetical protein
MRHGLISNLLIGIKIVKNGDEAEESIPRNHEDLQSRIVGTIRLFCCPFDM